MTRPRQPAALLLKLEEASAKIPRPPRTHPTARQFQHQSQVAKKYLEIPLQWEDRHPRLVSLLNKAYHKRSCSAGIVLDASGFAASIVPFTGFGNGKSPSSRPKGG